MEESELYPSVKEFIRNKYGCFAARIEAGKEGIGSVDIFGVYHKNIERTEIETVGVEVKISKIPIASSFGQAKGYSLFCHKMYFASLNEFDDENIEMAKHLGIGLISITKENAVFVCHEALEPSTSMPIKRLLDLVLERRKILACQSCKVIQERNYTKTIYGLDKIPPWNRNEVKKGKDLLIKNKDRTEFYCNKCARKILNLV